MDTKKNQQQEKLNYKLPSVNVHTDRRFNSSSRSPSYPPSPKSRRKSNTSSKKNSRAASRSSRSLSPIPDSLSKRKTRISSKISEIEEEDDEDMVFDENGQKIIVDTEKEDYNDIHEANELLKTSTALLKQDEESIPLTKLFPDNVNSRLDNRTRTNLSGTLEGGLGNGNDGKNNLNINMLDNERTGGGSSLIDINSNCCSYTSSQQNMRKIAINLVILISVVTAMAGVIGLYFKK